MSCVDLTAERLKEDVLNQSSSTWRHSNIQYTFPREMRFKHKKTDDPVYTLGSQLSLKTCSLGKGEKYYIPPWEQRKMRELPGPDRYHRNVLTTHSQHSRKSFSKGRRFSQNKLGVPGPGSYDGSRLSLTHIISLKGKLPEHPPKPSPSPFEYSIQDPHSSLARNITMKSRARSVKIDLTPGPGSYNICNWPVYSKKYKRSKRLREQIPVEVCGLN